MTCPINLDFCEFMRRPECLRMIWLPYLALKVRRTKLGATDTTFWGKIWLPKLGWPPLMLNPEERGEVRSLLWYRIDGRLRVFLWSVCRKSRSSFPGSLSQSHFCPGSAWLFPYPLSCREGRSPLVAMREFLSFFVASFFLVGSHCSQFLLNRSTWLILSRWFVTK